MGCYKEIFGSDLATKYKATLLALAFFEDETGRTDASLVRLGELLGNQPRHVRKKLKELSDMGLVKIERHRNPEGRRVNHYAITLPVVGASKKQFCNKH